MQITLKQFLLLAVNKFDGFIYLTSQDLVVEAQKDDPREELHHIEVVTDSIELAKLELPAAWKIWKKPDWILHEAQVQVRYKSWSKNKAVWDKYDRNLRKLSAGIVAMTGIDMETAKLMASKIIKTRPKKAANFDVTLEE